jgi:hypothetical protein
MLNYIIAYDSHLFRFSAFLFLKVHIEPPINNPKFFIADTAWVLYPYQLQAESNRPENLNDAPELYCIH